MSSKFALQCSWTLNSWHWQVYRDIHLTQLFEEWTLLSIGQIAIQWISVNKTNHAIRWIVIYPLDSIIHFSNNPGLYFVNSIIIFFIVTSNNTIIIGHFQDGCFLSVKISPCAIPFIGKGVSSRVSFSYERFWTRIRFDTESQGNSEMAYFCDI